MRNRENRFRKDWVSKEIRTKFAHQWTRKPFRSPSDESEAEYCMSLIDRCWRDMFGAKATNGKRKSSPGPFSERYRSLPDSVLEILERWHNGEIKLQLMHHVPSSIEVLRAQSRGERCVSALVKMDEIINFEEQGRDFLSFLIHDLVHAHHFFSDPQSLARQSHFSREMLPIVEAKIFANTEFEPEFDYLISDMNSHLVHLLKTLKSLTDRLGNSTLESHLSSRIPLWNELNSPGETPETHSRLLHLWDQRSTTHSTTVSK